MNTKKAMGWKYNECKKLIYLRDEENLQWSQISTIFNCTEKRCIQQYYSIKKPWNKNEYYKLISLKVKQQLDWKRISEKLQRYKLHCQLKFEELNKKLNLGYVQGLPQDYCGSSLNQLSQQHKINVREKVKRSLSFQKLKNLDIEDDDFVHKLDRFVELFYKELIE